MTIPLSIAGSAFPLLDEDKAYDLAEMLGFTGWDVMAIKGMSQLDVDDIVADPAGTARRISEQVGARGLEVADVFAFPGVGFEPLAVNSVDASVRQDSRDWFLRILEFAARVNAPGITMLPGVVWNGVSHDDALARAAEELAWRVEQARVVGVQVSVEPSVQSVIDTPELTRRLLDATPGLTLTLDYSHFIADGFGDEDCEPLLPDARHVHARGATRGRIQASVEPESKMPQPNVIDFGRMAQALQRQGYQGYICCEYVWIDLLGSKNVDNLSETIMLRDQLNAALAAEPADAAGAMAR